MARKSPCDFKSDLNYCKLEGNNPDDYFITNVTFNTINNNSVANGFGCYAAISTDVKRRNDYTLFVTMEPIGASTSIDVYVWFDWNQDHDFFDVGEEFLIGSDLWWGCCYGSYTISIPINIPSYSSPGNTRMRITLTYASNPKPCGGGEWVYEETEDYTINIE